MCGLIRSAATPTEGPHGGVPFRRRFVRSEHRYDDREKRYRYDGDDDDDDRRRGRKRRGGFDLSDLFDF